MEVTIILPLQDGSESGVYEMTVKWELENDYDLFDSVNDYLNNIFVKCQNTDHSLSMLHAEYEQVRSMMVGDVVKFTCQSFIVAYVCDRMGWRRVDPGFAEQMMKLSSRDRTGGIDFVLEHDLVEGWNDIFEPKGAIVINLEGGVVQDIVKPDKKDYCDTVVIKDFDVEGINNSDVMTDKYGDECAVTVY